jgi:uncharacterized phage protein (TIGR01671 family)
MREIRFRGRGILQNEFIYGCYVYDINTKSHYIGYMGGWVEDETWNTLYEVDPTTIGQYTGLKDIHGTSIYEGDILSCGNGQVPTEIMWSEENHAFYAFNLKRKEYHRLDKFFNRFVGDSVVIGNIHDNPEMIEQHGHTAE